MHMQFFDFFQNIAPISYDFRSMNIIADLVPVIINHTNNLLFHIAAVVDFFDDLVSCIPCSDHKYIPSVHTGSAHIAKHTQTAVRISASHDKYKQKQSIQNVKASWHRVHIPPVPKQYQHCHNNGIQNTCRNNIHHFQCSRIAPETGIQPEQPENDQRNNYHKRKCSPHFIHILKRHVHNIQIKSNQ